MSLPITDTSKDAPKLESKRNWWKVLFFVALFAFEIAREFAVVASAEDAVPNAPARVFSMAGYVSAKGSWKRIDGGGRMAPATITIECREATKSCIEASVGMDQKYVYAPELNWFDATFTPDAVSYENDIPDCAKYSVRIDLKMKKVFAVRERKNVASNATCAKLEQRLETQLADGYDTKDDPFDGRFLPVFQTIAALVKMF